MPREELNSRDLQENSLLFVTVKLCRRNPALLDVIKRMLQLGANPNVSDKAGWTPLDEAVNQVFFYSKIQD